MRHLKIFIVCLGLLAIAQAALSRGFTPEDLARLQWVNEIAIAPDGQSIAFTQFVPRNPFHDGNGHLNRELYLVFPNGETRPFITGNVDIRNIAWTPDGNEISFLAKREGDKEKSLYVIPVAGGEAVKLVELDESISEYTWSPDGNSIAVVTKEPVDKETARLKKLGFDMKVFEEDYRQNRLWLIDLTDPAAAPKMATIEESVSTINFSPDGSALSLTIQPTSLVDDRYTSRDIAVYDIASDRLSRIIATPGKLGDIAWSPDGRRLAFITAEDAFDPKEGRLAIQALEDESPYKIISTDEDGHLAGVAWLSEEELLTHAMVDVHTRIARIAADGSERKIVFEAPTPVPVKMSLAKDNKTLAVRASSPTHPDEVYYFSLDRDMPTRLTVSNPWLESLDLGNQEVITYQARDGVELQGLLIYPIGYEQGTRYPLLEVIHGGPESRMANDWLTWYSYPGQMAAARGYMVFYPNYRGSLGRGVAFSKLGQKDYGGAEFNDLVDAITHLANLGLIDRERVAITGRSYGGFASTWAATALSDHYKAAVAICGATNQTSKYGTTDIPEEMYLVHSRQQPWENWQWYLERSPIFHAPKSTTPLLMLHGEEDTRVHPAQSLELYRHLKVQGNVPVRLVLYPGEPHGTRNAAGRYDIPKRALRWIDWFIKGPGEGLPPMTPDYSPLETGPTVLE